MRPRKAVLVDEGDRGGRRCGGRAGPARDGGASPAPPRRRRRSDDSSLTGRILVSVRSPWWCPLRPRPIAARPGHPRPCRSARRRAAWRWRTRRPAGRRRRGAAACRACRRRPARSRPRRCADSRRATPAAFCGLAIRSWSPCTTSSRRPGAATGSSTWVDPRRERDRAAHAVLAGREQGRPAAEGVPDQAGRAASTEPLARAWPSAHTRVVDRGVRGCPSRGWSSAAGRPRAVRRPARASRAAIGTIRSTDSWVGLTRIGPGARRRRAAPARCLGAAGERVAIRRASVTPPRSSGVVQDPARPGTRAPWPRASRTA